jgi:hypothetical protein
LIQGFLAEFVMHVKRPSHPKVGNGWAFYRYKT